jgi:NAD-dependent DNA ligase
VENVVEFLRVAKETYYRGSPIISDSQYDALEEKYGHLVGVGYDINDGIPHYARLYSLDKRYVGEDDTRLPVNYVETPKMDGASVALVYIKGKLVSALTRGDGKIGKDVYSNMSTLVPEWIDLVKVPPIIQIRGEVVANKNIKNSRNYAAGALGLDDTKEFESRNLLFVAHEIYPTRHDTYSEDMDWVDTAGFVNVFYHELYQLTKTYPTDGLVHRCNSNALYETEGFTSKHPRAAYAVKERSEGIPTELIDVVWQTGKSGKVTPVAILAPIIIEDAIVSRATLNNVGFIESLGLEIGDTVLVERAGGIIPRIICKAE